MKKINDKLIPVLLFFIALLGVNNNYAQDQVDVGLFETMNTDRIVVKARPDYDLENQVSNVAFTIRWVETSNVSYLNTYLSIFSIQPQGNVEISDGYKHQAFAMVGNVPVDWTAGEEYVICDIEYVYITGDCTSFELINDTWSGSNNADYYFEVLGSDKTGIIYQSDAQVITVGGEVTGGGTICLGSNTGSLALTGYSGDVLIWQRRVDGGSWNDITGTGGMVSYDEVPSSAGIYEYRAEIQKFGCTIEYSLPATVEVAEKSIWTGDVDTSWDDSGNWNGCGIPDETTDVVIPQVLNGNYPIVDIAGVCKSLSVESGATVTLEVTGSLTVGGQVIDNAGKP